METNGRILTKMQTLKCIYDSSYFVKVTLHGLKSQLDARVFLLRTQALKYSGLKWYLPGICFKRIAGGVTEAWMPEAGGQGREQIVVETVSPRGFIMLVYFCMFSGFPTHCCPPTTLRTQSRRTFLNRPSNHSCLLLQTPLPS